LHGQELLQLHVDHVSPDAMNRFFHGGWHEARRAGDRSPPTRVSWWRHWLRLTRPTGEQFRRLW
jgi:hypothetical protein